MRILSLYTPIKRTNTITIISTRLYHSANFSGGGLLGSTTTPTAAFYSKPKDPMSTLEANQLADPRSVSKPCILIPVIFG